MKIILSKASVPAVFTVGSCLVLLFAGCGKQREEPTLTTRETVETKAQVQAYESNNSPEQKKRVELAFAELDKEIKELEVRVAETTGEARAEADSKLESLKKQRSDLHSDYTEAKWKALMDDVKNSFKK